MNWNRNLSNLRNVLAGLYGDVDEARRIVRDVQMDPAYISFFNRSINTWQSILEEALKHDKVADIVKKAREQYPSIQSLALAEHNLLQTVELPEFSESSWQGPTDNDGIEKIIGTISTLRPIFFLQVGLEKSRTVARVTLKDGSRGSGFLVNNDLLITNNHVIPSREVAQQAKIEFNCQKTAEGLDATVDLYTLEPEQGFATSPREEQGGDDWTAVRVRGNPNQKWGRVALAPASPKVKDEVVIIQHPGGGMKQIALSHNVVAFVDDRRLQYLTDTTEGSSGSPVFNTDWQLVAVHHKGGYLREPGSKKAVFRNQGIHINAVIAGLNKEGLLSNSAV